MYYTYLLESLKDKSWYIGYSADLRKRLQSHNHGENRATRTKKPWKLIYYEGYANQVDAKKREVFLKSGTGMRFLKKQISNYLGG